MNEYPPASRALSGSTPPAPIVTYSLDQVAAMALPADMRQPVLWLQRRLRRGLIPGYKVGRTWRMTHEDVEDFINDRRNRMRPRGAGHHGDDDDPRMAGKPPGLTRRSWIGRQNRRAR